MVNLYIDREVLRKGLIQNLGIYAREDSESSQLCEQYSGYSICMRALHDVVKKLLGKGAVICIENNGRSEDVAEKIVNNYKEHLGSLWDNFVTY